MLVRNEGTIVLVTPTNNAERAWLDEHIVGESMTLGPSLVVEHRYAPDLIAGIVADGMEVRDEAR